MFKDPAHIFAACLIAGFICFMIIVKLNSNQVEREKKAAAKEKDRS